MGTATLVAGTVTVSTTAVTANSRIFLTAQSLGTVSVGQGLAVSARSAGTSFTVLSGFCDRYINNCVDDCRASIKFKREESCQYHKSKRIKSSCGPIDRTAANPSISFGGSAEIIQVQVYI